MELTKREYLTTLYINFKEKTKEYLQNCSLFPEVEDLDLFDLLYNISIYFSNPKHYQDSFDTLLILYDIQLEGENYINGFKELIQFVEKVKMVK